MEHDKPPEMVRRGPRQGRRSCVAGVICVGAGLAGAQSNDAMKRSVPEASPGTTQLKPGTYSWFIDGLDRRPITFASQQYLHQHFWRRLWHLGPGRQDGGVEHHRRQRRGRCLRLRRTCQQYRQGDLVRRQAGRLGLPRLSLERKLLHHQACDRRRRAGRWFGGLGVRPSTAGHIVPGTYTWTATGGFSGSMSIASGNTYAITMSVDDSGTWAQGGSAFAFSIAEGTDEQGGCLEVGKVNTTGTAVGTTAKPGNWVCPVYGTHGTFVIS